MGRDRSKRGPIPQARAPRANVEVHLANNDILRNPLCMRQCQCPTAFPIVSDSGRVSLGDQASQNQVDDVSFAAHDVKESTSEFTQVQELPSPGFRSVREANVCNSSHLRSLSAPLSHLRKLTGLGLTEPLDDGIADGHLGGHIAFKQRPHLPPERNHRASEGDDNNDGQSLPEHCPTRRISRTFTQSDDDLLLANAAADATQDCVLAPAADATQNFVLVLETDTSQNSKLAWPATSACSPTGRCQPELRTRSKR